MEPSYKFWDKSLAPTKKIFQVLKSIQDRYELFKSQPHLIPEKLDPAVEQFFS
jgi:hypothetical protein